MFKNRRLGLQFKITFLIVVILFVMLMGQNLINIFFMKTITSDLSSQLFENTLRSNAKDIRDFVVGPFNRLDGAASVLQDLLDSGSVDGEAFEDIVRSLTESSADNVSGYSILIDKNAFDNNSTKQSLNGFSIYVSKTSDGLESRGLGGAEYAANYYIEPMNTGTSYITDVFYYDTTGRGDNVLMYTSSEPLFNENGKPIGVVVVDAFTANIQNDIQKSITLKGASLLVISHTGAIVSIDEGLSKHISKNIYEALPYYQKYDIFGKKDSGKYSTFTVKDSISNKNILHAMLPVDVGDGKYWSVILLMPENILYMKANNSTNIVFIIALIITILLGALIALVIKKRFTSIMKVLVLDIKRLASGDLSIDVPVQMLKMKDEWGDIANAVSFLVNKLKEIVGNVQNSAAEIEAAANEVAHGNIDLSKRTEMQAASVEETASSMVEMSAAITSSSINSVDANKMMHFSKDSVKEASMIISDTTKNIGEVFEASSKIENITKIIESIAFQTNILALNAAVEAARAGEQGRGFAVVASEVRNLAQTTQSSVKDITDLVVDVNEKIQKSTDTVYKSKTIFEEIEIKIGKSSDLIEAISNASVEQQSGIEEINKAINEMEETTQQNAALVEESAATSESLLSQTQLLVDTINFFKNVH